MELSSVTTGFRLARTNRKVIFATTDNTVTGMGAVLDAVDAKLLAARLNQLATILAQAGSTESAQVRRAISLGMLASPARALQLLQASLLDDQLPADVHLDCPARGQRGMPKPHHPRRRRTTPTRPTHTHTCRAATLV